VKLRFLILLIAAVAAFSGLVGAPSSASSALAPTASAKPCGSGYTHAVLSWGHKCLRVGQFCKRSADREYHRYRLHCHRYDSSVSRYRLTR
jgi:hypothetical protein